CTCHASETTSQRVGYLAYCVVLSQKSAIAGAVRSVDESPDLAVAVSEDRHPCGAGRWARAPSRTLSSCCYDSWSRARSLPTTSGLPESSLNTILLIAIGLVVFTTFPRLTRVLSYPVADALLSVW